MYALIDLAQSNFPGCTDITLRAAGPNNGTVRMTAYELRVFIQPDPRPSVGASPPTSSTPAPEHLVRESLTSFLVDPPDTDWQRGYLAALLFILNTGLGLPQTDPLYIKASLRLK